MNTGKYGKCGVCEFRPPSLPSWNGALSNRVYRRCPCPWNEVFPKIPSNPNRSGILCHRANPNIAWGSDLQTIPQSSARELRQNLSDKKMSSFSSLICRYYQWERCYCGFGRDMAYTDAGIPKLVPWALINTGESLQNIPAHVRGEPLIHSKDQTIL